MCTQYYRKKIKCTPRNLPFWFDSSETSKKEASLDKIATNPNDMLNTYFELVSSNNTGESIAFVVTDITFKVAVMTSSVTKSSFLVNITFVVTEIAFKVAVMTSSVAKITFTVVEITFKMTVITSSMVEITFVVTEITF